MQASGRRFDPVQLHHKHILREKKMAVPKSKITRSKRGMRRAHDALKHDTFVENKDTGELHRPHHLDLKTGMYNGRQVLNIKTKS